MRGESGISLTGLCMCGAIAFVMLALKLSVIDTWSWWRVLLPLGLIVGFTLTNIVVAFIYLSFAHIPERPDGDEADVLEPHTINVHYVMAMLFFIVFGDNVVRWIEGSATAHWFWLRDFEVGQSDSYTVKKPANGAYFFVLEGAITIAGEQLERRDGLGVEDASSIDLTATADCQLLIMDVPMQS